MSTTISQISFEIPMPSSLQVGDTLHAAYVYNHTSGITGPSFILGEIIDLSDSRKVVTIVGAVSGLINFPSGVFFFFSKNVKINESSLKGYYADVTMQNSSMEKAELFAISSEIAPSSK